MTFIRLAFPASKRAEKCVVYEVELKCSSDSLTWDAFVSKLSDMSRTKKGRFYVTWHGESLNEIGMINSA